MQTNQRPEQGGIQILPVPGIPLVQAGDDVAALLVEAAEAAGIRLRTGDILVVAQKIVSKAEGRLVRLAQVEPNAEAVRLAEETGKDARVVQAVLDDSAAVIRAREGVLIVEQSSGWVCAHAGLDHSNVAPEEEETVALLPADADASAGEIRSGIGKRTGAAVAVLISDSHGRPWRMGTVGVCIGCSGLPAVWDQRGLTDLYGYELRASEECIADELCAAASLVMGQSGEGRPAAIIRGYGPPDVPNTSARAIQRPAQKDLFR
ncbi:MAG: coenzyme F420-0:L-glutamate ligase [Caldilineaceae bacterium]|nr:coenzyme F420-0:L-glutamate ligase [Caldilineaceae bacterium]